MGTVLSTLFGFSHSIIPINLWVNSICTLLAYCFLSKKWLRWHFPLVQPVVFISEQRELDTLHRWTWDPGLWLQHVALTPSLECTKYTEAHKLRNICQSNSVIFVKVCISYYICLYIFPIFVLEKFQIYTAVESIATVNSHVLFMYNC